MHAEQQITAIEVVDSVIKLKKIPGNFSGIVHINYVRMHA